MCNFYYSNLLWKWRKLLWQHKIFGEIWAFHSCEDSSEGLTGCGLCLGGLCCLQLLSKVHSARQWIIGTLPQHYSVTTQKTLTSIKIFWFDNSKSKRLCSSLHRQVNAHHTVLAGQIQKTEFNNHAHKSFITIIIRQKSRTNIMLPTLLKITYRKRIKYQAVSNMICIMAKTHIQCVWPTVHLQNGTS